MPKSNETTTKFKVDISELKAGIQEANRQIALANSEFKKASAGMESWGRDADGLSAKITQLRTVTAQYETILGELKSQYAKVVAEQGENSKGATELKIKINSLEASIKNNNNAIKNYETRLNDLTSETKQTDSAMDTLKQSISEQESKLKTLKTAYANVVLEQGKTSKEARQLETEISQLSGELVSNKTKLKGASDAADQLDKSLKDTKDSSKDAADGFTVMKGALADLIADGIRSAIDGLKEFVTASDSAHKKFQAATGLSTEEVAAFKDEMDDLYDKGYGESIGDIGDKMAYVKQVTGEIDASNVRELVENAMALEDTFGSDFNETIRGVNNLMQHFGIDSKTAFDLFAKGSQLGLDYTGELGDNIAEYGGNFEQAGYSAEEYFQLLVNGSKNGAYNLDKVNDSINEVKNRLADGSIEKNIDIFSEGTQSAFKAWKDGKGTMKDVIDSIVGDINNCTNEQDALTMAATAFGTMGEDANLKVVKSLTTVGDSFKDVGGTMQDIKDIRYDDVATQFTALGRKLQRELLTPLAQKALPLFEQLGDYAIKNIDGIANAIKVLGSVMGTVFVVNKVATFTNSIKTLATTFGLVKGATDAAKVSSLALNATWLASPVTWLVAGLAALTAGMVVYNQKQKEAIKEEYGLSEAQQKSVETSSALKTSYDEMNKSRSDAMASINAEYGYINELKDELNGLIGTNGQVKEGYEDRANFIVNQLASALGIEKDKIWEIINANGSLGESIDQIIQKKQAEAILNANEAAYTEAIQKRTEALNTYQSAIETLDGAESKYKQTRSAANEVLENYNTLLAANPDEAARYYMANKSILDANDEAKASYEKAKKGVEDSEAAYVGYNTTIQNYEGLSSAIISGDAAKIEAALVNMQNSFITAENGTKATLQRQVKDMEENYTNLKKAIENGTPGVTQAQVDAAKQMVDKAIAELDTFEGKAETSTQKGGEGARRGFESKIPSMGTTSQNGVDALINPFDLSANRFFKTGEKSADKMDKGAASKKKTIETTGKDLSKTLDSGMGSANTSATGSKKSSEYNSGAASNGSAIGSTGMSLSSNLNSGLGSADTRSTGSGQTTKFNIGVGSVGTFNVGADRAYDAKDGMDSVDASSSGSYFGQGFINGLASMAQAAWDAGWNFVKNAWAGLKAGQDEGSPSKLTYQSGLYFTQGFVNAIADTTRLAVKAAREMAKDTAKELDKVDMPKLDTNITPRSLNRTGGVGSRIGYGQNGGIVQNFYQNNYSPKPLNRLEIYRQTRNQLAAAKGV